MHGSGNLMHQDELLENCIGLLPVLGGTMRPAGDMASRTRSARDPA